MLRHSRSQIVTATTVGYGDQYIATDAGRLWASLHILLSVVMLAELFDSLNAVRTQREAMRRAYAQMQARLSPGLVDQLLKRTKAFRKQDPLCKRNETHAGSVNLHEFVLSMLVDLKMAEAADIRNLVRQFRHFDVNVRRPVPSPTRPHPCSQLNAHAHL